MSRIFIFTLFLTLSEIGCQNSESPNEPGESSKEVMHTGFILGNDSLSPPSIYGPENFVELSIRLRSPVSYYRFSSMKIETETGMHWNFDSTGIMNYVNSTDSSLLEIPLATNRNQNFPLRNYTVTYNNNQPFCRIFVFARNDPASCPLYISHSETSSFTPPLLDSIRYQNGSVDTLVFYLTLKDTLTTDFIEIEADSGDGHYLPIDTMYGHFIAGKYALKYYASERRYSYLVGLYSKVIDHEGSYYYVCSRPIASPALLTKTSAPGCGITRPALMTGRATETRSPGSQTLYQGKRAIHPIIYDWASLSVRAQGNTFPGICGNTYV
jgi:hypothetical protein